MNRTKSKAKAWDAAALARLLKSAYQLKITLKETNPPIWRRLVVPGDIRLGKLHSVLQGVMGWTNSHLHEFVFGEGHFGVKDPDSPDVKPERDVVLGRIVSEEGTRFLYLYDFGDGWEHDVVVEKIGAWPPGRSGPFCLEGARACPPEDVGGVGGYEDFLKTMAGPDSEERKEFVRWVGGEFDPEDFSVEEVNRLL